MRISGGAGRSPGRSRARWSGAAPRNRYASALSRTGHVAQPCDPGYQPEADRQRTTRHHPDAFARTCRPSPVEQLLQPFVGGQELVRAQGDYRRPGHAHRAAEHRAHDQALGGHAHRWVEARSDPQRQAQDAVKSMNSGRRGSGAPPSSRRVWPSSASPIRVRPAPITARRSRYRRGRGGSCSESNGEF